MDGHRASFWSRITTYGKHVCEADATPMPTRGQACERDIASCTSSFEATIGGECEPRAHNTVCRRPLSVEPAVAVDPHIAWYPNAGSRRLRAIRGASRRPSTRARLRAQCIAWIPSRR
jgi:hypothetical protein